MDKYVQQAMDIANNREQSIFQQRNEFQVFLETVIEESKQKFLEQLKQDKQT